MGLCPQRENWPPASGGHRAEVRERLSSDHEMRMTVSLPEEQAERLAELCREEGISRAEAVRRAVDRYLDPYRRRRREEGFGIWRRRGMDGLSHERRMRAEWS